MKIDAHQHFWRYNPTEYGWMGPGLESLRRDYMPEDLIPLLQTVGFESAVLVQARQTLGETAWMLELADRHPFICGMVGWVDLCSPQVEAHLAQFAGHPRLVSMRHLLESEADDAYALRPEFLRGVRALGQFGLAYDIVIRHRQMPEALGLVERFPEQRFVLDHIGKPAIAEGCLEPWATQLRALAAHPLVACKLSGLVTEADRPCWRPTDLRPYLDVVLEAFGPERVMIGSDWPVCTLAGNYVRVMRVVLDYVGLRTPVEQEAILGDNAARIYRLPA